MERGLNEQLYYVLSNANHNIDGLCKDLSFIRKVADNFEAHNKDEDFEAVVSKVDDLVNHLDDMKVYLSNHMIVWLGLQSDIAAAKKLPK